MKENPGLVKSRQKNLRDSRSRETEVGEKIAATNSHLGKTDSLTYGGAHKCSEEANCDTPIVYETYIQGLLQCYSINVIMHMRCKKMHEPKSSILSLKIFVSCAFH